MGPVGIGVISDSVETVSVEALEGVTETSSTVVASAMRNRNVAVMTRRLARNAVFIKNSKVVKMIVGEVGKQGVAFIIPQ
jgi:hypothetical protein